MACEWAICATRDVPKIRIRTTATPVNTALINAPLKNAVFSSSGFSVPNACATLICIALAKAMLVPIANPEMTPAIPMAATASSPRDDTR